METQIRKAIASVVLCLVLAGCNDSSVTEVEKPFDTTTVRVENHGNDSLEVYKPNGELYYSMRTPARNIEVETAIKIPKVDTVTVINVVIMERTIDGVTGIDTLRGINRLVVLEDGLYGLPSPVTFAGYGAIVVNPR